MYIFLILFFASSFGIIIMIGRKLVLLRNGQGSENLITEERKLFEIPYIKEMKRLTIENTRKYARVSLVASLRFYIRSMNLLKNKYEEIKTKIKNMNMKNHPNGDLSEKVEVSKFLKMISDYKHKIREIKHKIHEEEKNS